MPTWASVGEWKISSALRKEASAFLQPLLGDVVEEFALDAERPADELNLDLALRADRLHLVLEQTDDVAGIDRRGNGDHRARVGRSFGAAASTAAPPRLWPIRIAGAP